MSFDDYIIDAAQSKVAVVGHARFRTKETGQSWQEVLAHRLLFDNDMRLTRYELWADSGSLHLARQGKLLREQAVMAVLLCGGYLFQLAILIRS